jgi:hypothetical protein
MAHRTKLLSIEIRQPKERLGQNEMQADRKSLSSQGLNFEKADKDVRLS